MDRRKLVFFVTADPATGASRVTSAYHLALAAAASGLQAEVRLAGDAVLVADPAYVATLGAGQVLRRQADQARRDGVAVSVCPRSMADRGVGAGQVAAIGAVPRLLGEVLVEVAEGRSVLVAL
ncbi:MAG: DsrE family protein [Acidimicrobiales bacterium]